MKTITAAQATVRQRKTELADRLASMMLELEVLDRSRDDNAEITSKVFELSQTLRQRWLIADYAEKRKILEIVWLNCRLIDGSLSPQIRKPFDIVVEGLLSEKSGG